MSAVSLWGFCQESLSGHAKCKPHPAKYETAPVHAYNPFWDSALEILFCFVGVVMMVISTATFQKKNYLMYKELIILIFLKWAKFLS